MGVWKPVISIQSHSDTNSSGEILQKVCSLQKKSLHLNKKNILGEYFSLSQVCETIYQYIHRLKLLDNFWEKNF